MNVGESVYFYGFGYFKAIDQRLIRVVVATLEVED